MPKLNNLTKESVLNAGIKLIRSKQEVSARNLANLLNCSTQPIYSLYSNMNNLKDDLRIAIQKLHKEKIDYYIKNSTYPKYKAFGMGFVKFAKEERELFSYLFMKNNGSPYETAMKDYYSEIHSLISKDYGIPLETAQQFHLDMSVYSFGLAIMVYLGVDLIEEEISKRLTAEFSALKKIYLEK